jgi:phenylpropionate dioxygenase-like ring-hydroxylating dioxygenase large terminal subunit
LAKVEREFIAARGDQLNRGAYQAPPFLPRKPIPDIGHERIDGERFFSPQFMSQEWRRMWTKVWLLAVRENDLPDPGSFQTLDFGKESFLFVRGEDGNIRGFYNVCRHRGNILCQVEQGDATRFQCPYHGWQWNLDGSLRAVAHPRLYRQFDDGVPTGELGLAPVTVDIWGGWVWFTMNDAAAPLRDYLGELAVHLETYELEKFQLVDYQTFEWKGNWKHAHDAFNESYHFETLHPEFTNFTEGYDIPIELCGIHSRMLNFNSTVSEVVEDRDTLTPIRQKMIGLPDYSGSAKDIHLEVIARKRAIQHDTYLPYRRMNDEQLVHQYHYTFFPNATFTQSAESCIVFRYRPHATDPNICYYDFFITAHNPPGTPAPEYTHHVYRHDNLPDYADAFSGTFDPVFCNVLREDGSNMPTMQRGVQSDSFKGMILCEQEVRVRHFHQTIDRFLASEVEIPPLERPA